MSDITGVKTESNVVRLELAKGISLAALLNILAFTHRAAYLAQLEIPINLMSFNFATVAGYWTLALGYAALVGVLLGFGAMFAAKSHTIAARIAPAWYVDHAGKATLFLSGLAVFFALWAPFELTRLANALPDRWHTAASFWLLTLAVCLLTWLLITSKKLFTEQRGELWVASAKIRRWISRSNWWVVYVAAALSGEALMYYGGYAEATQKTEYYVEISGQHDILVAEFSDNKAIGFRYELDKRGLPVLLELAVLSVEGKIFRPVNLPEPPRRCSWQQKGLPVDRHPSSYFESCLHDGHVDAINSASGKTSSSTVWRKNVLGSVVLDASDDDRDAGMGRTDESCSGSRSCAGTPMDALPQ